MEITSYGKSMYGGWYVDFIKDGVYSGKGFRTLKECKEFAKINNCVLVNRFDNI